MNTVYVSTYLYHSQFNFMGYLNKNSRKMSVASAEDFTCEIKNNF